MPAQSTTALELLLADAGWVRSLARRLAGRDHEVDDLVQETCLVALQRPPHARDNLRGWLAAVLRNVVRQRQRSATRRQQRDLLRQQQPLPVEPSPADLVERAATQRALVDAVVTLDEPYRSAILLRFFEDLPPRAIGKRLQLPIATVHTHLTRGLEQLRKRLDTSRGGRARWAALLLPLPPFAPFPVALPLLGLLAMNTKILAVVATVAIGALAIGFGTDLLRDPVPSHGAAREAAPAVAASPSASPENPAAAETVRRDAAIQAAPAPAPARAEPQRLVRGRTVDAEGRPAPGLAVTFRAGQGAPLPDAEHSTSDAAAAFSLPLASDGGGRVVVEQPGWSTVCAAMIKPGELPSLALVVAAPAVELAGVVRGPDGRPVPGAQVQVVWPADLRTRLSDISDAAAEEHLAAAAAADGTFALRAARVRGAVLRTSAAGYVPDQRPVPELDDRTLAIALAQPTARAGTVQGQVIDARGLPVEGAQVALGGAVVKSDGDGRFLVDDGGASTLAAAFAGHRRATLPRPASGWPPFVVLELGGRPLSIQGRTVDGEGKAVAGAKVWLVDATLFSNEGPVVAEGIAASRTTFDELRKQYQAGRIRDPEATLRNTPTAAWPFVFSAGDGRFELPGLEDRSYDLRAMDPATLLMVDQKGVAAGCTGVEIVMPADALFTNLAGVVVARDGTPLAGVSVRVQCDTVSVGNTNMHADTTARTVTDADGRFALANVPKTRVYLRLDGEPILPLEYGRRVAGGLLELCGGDPGQLRIVVGVRLHVQVELADPALATDLAVLDGDGKPIVINVFVGRGRREVDRLAFEAGKSPVFVVPDTTATLVLWKGRAEVRREALRLQAGAVNKLTY